MRVASDFQAALRKLFGNNERTVTVLSNVYLADIIWSGQRLS